MGSMVVFSNVTKRYPGGTTALDQVSFELEDGEFLFLSGPSGAGKTTAVRLLLALERPSAGEAIVARRNVHALRAAAIPYLRRNIGVVFQDFRLIRSRTVFDNVALALQVLGLPPGQVRQRVIHVLEVLGLTHLAMHLPPMLSGGEQQRVAIARAIVNDPPFIVADEPTGNLDPVLSMEVMDLLMESHRRGASVIVATHDIALMSQYKARCVLLEQGRKVGECITGEEFLETS